MDLKTLKNIVEGNTCFVCLSGKSLEQLEIHIEELKDLNVIWIGLNYFKLPEIFILNKINKQFSIVFDCSGVSCPENYEPQHRVPMLTEFLSRNANNIWITSYSLLKDMIRNAGQNDFILKYKNQTLILDNILKNPNYPKEVLVRFPNSLTGLLSMLIAGMAKRVVLFGFDGLLANVNRTPEQNINTYYKSELVIHERMLACGRLHPGILAWDSEEFDKRFPEIERIYRGIFGNPTMEILNCSPTSIIKYLRKINYPNIKKEII